MSTPNTTSSMTAQQWTLTALAPHFNQEQCRQVESFIQAQAFEQIDKKTLTHADNPHIQAIQYTLTPPQHFDAEQFKQQRLAFCEQQRLDLVLQTYPASQNRYRLACFDMDSTLIQHEVIDELAIEAGIGEQVAAITASAMRGELDFQQSFTARMALLKGLDATVVEKIAQRLNLMAGAERLFKGLNQCGFTTVILSGGFQYFAEFLQNKLHISQVHANHLDIVNGQLTGEVRLPIIDAQRKADLLQQIAREQQIDLTQSIAVGDGANDLLMLATAGLGIAYHAKPLVKATAPQTISTVGLDGILYLLGLSDAQIDAFH